MPEGGIHQVEESRSSGGNIRMIFCYGERVANPSVCPQCRRVVLFTLILFCVVVNGGLFATMFRHRKIQYLVRTLDVHQDEFLYRRGEEEKADQGKSPAWVLIEETQAAVAAAGGEPGMVLGAEERKTWETAHPCAGRQRLHSLWARTKRSPPITHNNTKTTTIHPASSQPSPLLHVLFQEYANLHRTCTRGGDTEYVRELYTSSNESAPCKFLVVEFGSFGVGNRLLWLVSAYQYALLTQRVILIDTRSTVHKLICDPFPGSSWLLPNDFPYSSDQRWPMPSEFLAAWDESDSKGLIVSTESVNEKNPSPGKDGLTYLSMEDIDTEIRETQARIRAEIQSKVRTNYAETIRKMGAGERRLSEAQGNSPSVHHFHHAQANDGWSPNPRFFCAHDQEHLQEVNWISLSRGCLYFLPDLFASPSFQPALEELFPNRDPLTHLLRQLTVPVDAIWTKVRDLYTKEFLTASKVVGMQVRYRNGLPMYRNLNPVVNNRISQCGQEHGLIPDPSATPVAGTLNGSRESDGPVVIYIASLYPGIREHLENVYEETFKGKRGGDPSVKILQLSTYGFQSFDLGADQQAFLEIVCLSLVDELLTSPQSTYGQMAQAFGGLTPWLIDFTLDSSSNCVRGQSTDACYQSPIDKFTCPFNKDVDGKAMWELAPYLKTCQDTDGLQLVPPWSPSLLP